MDFSVFLPMVIGSIKELASAALDSIVKGEELNETQIKAIQSGYIEAKIWLEKLVHSSSTPYDDMALNLFIKQCEDAAEEGGFALPELPG